MSVYHWDAGGTASNAGRFNRFCLPLMIACCGLYVGLDALGAKPHLGDVDDILRAIQVRQLWNGSGWYDLSLPMIRMPETYVSPWSRLVDLPYVLIANLLTFLTVDRETALRWSFHLWPPAMLVMFCCVAFDILRRLAVSAAATRSFTIVATILFILPMCGEFTPGRIDHHNMQILLLALLINGLIRANTLGGIVGGVSTALSLAIGLECLPVMVGIFGSLVLAWICGMEGARRSLYTVMFSTSVATPLVALAFIGPVGISSTQCDSFSAPYLYIAALSSALAGIVVLLTPEISSAWRRSISLALPIAGIVLGFMWLFPGCLAGPYSIIDPVSKHFWFDRIEQERSVLILFGRRALPQTTLVTSLVLIALLAAPIVIRRIRFGRLPELILFSGAASALLMTLLLTRFINFADAMVPLLLPLVVERFLGDATSARKAQTGILVTLVATVASSILLFVLVPHDFRERDTIDIFNNDDCKRGSFAALTQLPPGLIIAPSGLSLTLATDAAPGKSVAGIPFHRASPGLRRTYEAFTSGDSVTRREAMGAFDYVAVCRVEIPLDEKEAPLYAALANGKSWPGLDPLNVDADNAFRIFRIDHDLLR
jgi:hypothetical protein